MAAPSLIAPVNGRASAAELPSRLSPQQILDEALQGGVVLQDFCPLAESLEWELGQRYWLERGSHAFISDPEPVPFLINNDGNLSIQAAEVFFASCQAADQARQLPEDLFVLELGIGVGLFARFFLDWFRHLCDQAGADYYDRLCYVAADRSEKMLRDAGRHGIFLNHPGRYRLRVADALCPGRTLLDDPDVRRLGPRPFRAVFLNYLLDCLPAMVLKTEGESVRQLHVRTAIAPGTNWREFLDVSADELRWLARSTDARDRRTLLGINHLLTSVYAYRPVEAERVPRGDFAVPLVRGVAGRPVLHSHGAIDCLEGLRALLADGGFILLNDYGQVGEVASEAFEHQRFSQATGVGVNFGLLRAYFHGGQRGQWLEPPGQAAGLHSRLLGEGLAEATRVRFEEEFAAAKRAWREEPARRARECLPNGRYQAALAEYRVAFSRQPLSWALKQEVAQLLNGGLGAPAAGLDMARAALEHNPACSADLWNTLGESLVALGRRGEARQAYERALAISPDDVRARLDLASWHTQQAEYGRALEWIAQGLARDRLGAFREALLGEQNHVLGHLNQQLQRRHLGSVNRVAGVESPLQPIAGAKGLPPAPPIQSWGSPSPGRQEGQART